LFEQNHNMLGRCESLLHANCPGKKADRGQRWDSWLKVVRTRIFRIKSERELYVNTCRKRHMSKVRGL
jgi:hypothetical protein